VSQALLMGFGAQIGVKFQT